MNLLCEKYASLSHDPDLHPDHNHKEYLQSVLHVNGSPAADDLSVQLDFAVGPYPARLMKNLQALRKNSRFCDVKISVQNTLFTVSFQHGSLGLTVRQRVILIN